MKKICFATQNKNKIEELNLLLSETNFVVETNFIYHDVIEDGLTLRENALKKAKAMFTISNTLSLADDTGLEVFYLNMEPGVFSARYSGDNATYESNNKKLLLNLLGVPERRRNAIFKSVIAFVGNGIEETFEGITEGIIIESPQGEFGFGYDPLFKPLGYDKTYAEMSLNEKNLISHRAKAFRKFVEYLKKS